MAKALRKNTTWPTGTASLTARTSADMTAKMSAEAILSRIPLNTCMGDKSVSTPEHSSTYAKENRHAPRKRIGPNLGAQEPLLPLPLAGEGRGEGELLHTVNIESPPLTRTSARAREVRPLPQAGEVKRD